jgi:hypothetical protein
LSELPLFYILKNSACNTFLRITLVLYLLTPPDVKHKPWRCGQWLKFGFTKGFQLDIWFNKIFRGQNLQNEILRSWSLLFHQNWIKNRKYHTLMVLSSAPLTIIWLPRLDGQHELTNDWCPFNFLILPPVSESPQHTVLSVDAVNNVL